MFRPEIKVVDCTIRDGGLSNDSHFTLDVIQTLRVGHIAVVRDLQSDSAIFNQVLGCKYSCETTLAKASQNSVLVQPAANSQCRSVVITREDLQGGGHRHLVGGGNKLLVGRAKHGLSRA